MRSLMANLKAVFRTSTIASTGIARTARAVPSISFSGSISRRPTVTSLRQRQQLALRQDHRMRGGKVGGKRIGGAVTMTNHPYSSQKIVRDLRRKTKNISLAKACGRQVACGMRESMPDRDRIIAQRLS